jgi:hypothetical protein
MILTDKVVIQFNERIQEFELWIHHYNFADKLYPLSYSSNITSSNNLKFLIGIAKRDYPDIFNHSTIIGENIKNRTISYELRY